MSTPRRFRFGVQTTNIGSAKDWRERARMVESLGYSTLFMPDHFVDTQLAPMVGISFAAAVTERLRIGMLEFGLGAGWQRTDYDALGLPYDSPGTRIERLGEAISIIKGAWGPGPFD